MWPGRDCGGLHPVKSEETPVVAFEVIGDEVPVLLPQEMSIRLDFAERMAAVLVRVVEREARTRRDGVGDRADELPVHGRTRSTRRERLRTTVSWPTSRRASAACAPTVPAPPATATLISRSLAFSLEVTSVPFHQ